MVPRICVVLLGFISLSSCYPRFRNGVKYRLVNEYQGWCRSLASHQSDPSRLIMARIDHLDSQFWTISYKQGYFDGPAVKLTQGRRSLAYLGNQSVGLALSDMNDDNQYWKLAHRGHKWLKLTSLSSAVSLDLAPAVNQSDTVVKLIDSSHGGFVMANWQILESEEIIHESPQSLGAKEAEFFHKYINMSGFPVVASDKASDEALYRLYFIVQMMLSKLPTAAYTVWHLVREDVPYMALIAPSEDNCQMPANKKICSNDAKVTTFWNWQARGMGGYAASCGEENVMCHDKDRWCLEDICVHEFAHLIGKLLLWWSPLFNEELLRAFERAKSVALFNNTFAIRNMKEYWAEGVQTWFDVNSHHGQPNEVPPYQKPQQQLIYSRDELRDYDPYLYQLISKYLPEEVNSCSCHERKIRTQNQCKWPEGKYWVPKWIPDQDI